MSVPTTIYKSGASVMQGSTYVYVFGGLDSTGKFSSELMQIGNFYFTFKIYLFVFLIIVLLCIADICKFNHGGCDISGCYRRPGGAPACGIFAFFFSIHH